MHPEKSENVKAKGNMYESYNQGGSLYNLQESGDGAEGPEM